MRTLFWLVAFSLLPLGGGAWGADATLTQAQQLLESKDGQAAYDLLKPLEGDRAGDPEFDLLLGAAALEVKRPSEAVFALERVLAVNPNNPVARALIARAYFETGETRTAKQEFESAQRLAPPPEAAATIQRFLDTIERLDAGVDTKLTGYIEASVGHDSNVNNATAGNQVAVPFFGGALFTLSAAGVKASDDFLSLGAGVSVRHSFRRGLALVAGLDLNQRANQDQTQFDTSLWSGYGGLNFTQEKNSYTVALQGQQFYLDGSRFRDAFGATGQWQHAFDDFNSLSAYLQVTRLDYPGQNLRDANRTVAGLGYARALEGDRKPVVFVGGYAGEERERASGVPHLGHRLLGLRLGGQLSLRENLTLFASGSVEQRDYGGPDPLFLVTRDDTQSDLRAGLNYVPAKLWTVTPQISYTRNKSNVPINDFKRTVIFVTLRRDFR